MAASNLALSKLIREQEGPILDEWMSKVIGLGGTAANDAKARQMASALLQEIQHAMGQDGNFSLSSPEWAQARALLADFTAARAKIGATPRETAIFVFALKEALFARVRSAFARDPDALAEETWAISKLVDELGIYTMEAYQKTREDVIKRQQEDMLELSVPVVQLWDDVLGLPLIGTLDSERTQVVMESLLQKIVETGASIAIIDITGVPTVDTLVAQHLLKTVAAARLMGADCIISGIRPQIAQTIVHLGVDLEEVVTKATLADAFRLALKQTGSAIVKA